MSKIKKATDRLARAILKAKRTPKGVLLEMKEINFPRQENKEYSLEIEWDWKNKTKQTIDLGFNCYDCTFQPAGMTHLILYPVVEGETIYDVQRKVFINKNI